MSRRLRRHQGEADLNITAFLNLMVILIPFLLMTAAFSRFSILDLYLPPASQGQNQALKELQLEVIIRKGALELADSNGGLIRRIVNGPEGYDLPALNELLTEVKARFPKKRNILILSESNTSYEVVVKVMDAVRMTEIVEAGYQVKVELFPEISLGDAPPAIQPQTGETS